MRIPWAGFKLCFAVAALLAACGGCQTAASNPKRLTATLRFYLEGNPDTTGRKPPVPVYRERPILISVEPAPFLDERYVTNAVVVDEAGGFLLKVQFDGTGTKVLEQYSTANRGRHFAVFSRFGQKTFQERWLAAPPFTRTVDDGTLLFTPDATREETEQIARGVLNLKKKIVKKGEW